MYYIYDQQSTRILSREGKRYYQQAAYKTYSAAQAALTRMQKKYVQREGVAAQAQGPLYTAAIAEAEYYSKNIEPQPLHVLASNFRNHCATALSTTVHEDTEYIMATFKNSIVLQKHIIDTGGILLLQNVYSLEPHGQIAPNSMLFSEWLKQEDNE